MRSSLVLLLIVLAFCGPTRASAADATAARLAALEARVNAIEDGNSIERLIRAYGYYFDKGLWMETTTLFADDAVVEIAQRGIYHGRTSIERLYVQLFGHGKA